MYVEKPSLTVKPTYAGGVRKISKGNHCEHRYRKLDVTTERKYLHDINIKAVFYCEKCLDIKTINKPINFLEGASE